MSRKKLGDFAELKNLAQVSERVPKDTDRIAITRFGRNLNMCVSTLIEYINDRLTQGGSVSEELSLIRESIVNLQNQIDVLTETDLSELLSKLNDIKDFLDNFGEEENLSEILATLQSAIMADVAEEYTTKEELETLEQTVEENTAAIETLISSGKGNIRITRTAYNTLKNSDEVQNDMWYIITDNTDLSIIREIRMGLTLIAKNEDQGNNGFTYVFPFTFTS